MASMVTNPVTNANSDRTKRKKKKSMIMEDNHQSHARWKSEAQQQIYSSKLLQALSQVSLNTPSSSAPRGGRAVREAADRALARGAAVAAITGSSRSKKPRFSVSKLKSKSLPAVQRKVKVLGRLVPGCRKQPLPIILEEATDYIAALEMQVRAMTTLAELLSGSGAASSGSALPLQSPPPSQ
ncbi:hypothetical protein Gotri_004526 [Gossypium trilobum]|uniref:BHLH domain-containing protein n=1 Tax=Gossypium trilobum TaxID=34281 RepID=A0A7J9F544_9ROSI|nr:hypothetical protein [Gossypium trilobum]